MATLTITFTEATPTPAAGYRVTYWPTGSPGSAVVVTPNPTASPVVITGLAGTSYSGTIEAACGGGLYSSPQAFSADTTGGDTCDCYTVNTISGETITVSYTDCLGNPASGTFGNADSVITQPGSGTPTITLGTGTLTGPFACIS